MRGENFVYAWNMASDRMMQAIRTLERAIDRLEQDVEGLAAAPVSSSGLPAGALPGIDAAAARAALRSLDSLITELKGQDVKERAGG